MSNPSQVKGQGASGTARRGGARTAHERSPIRGVSGQGPGKVAIRPHLSDNPTSWPPRHATALVQAGSQIPATGMFGHLVQTATLPGSCVSGKRPAN
jgi:hypothetical protein